MTHAARAAGDAAGPTRGVVRLGRAAVLGGVSLLLSAAAHLIGGGHLSSTGVLLVTAGLLGVVALTATAHRCRFWLVLAVMAAEQLLLHLLFAATAAAGSCAWAMAGMGHPLPAAQHSMAACLPAPTAAAMTTMAMPGWAMWAGHATATLVAAWVLARGEAWLWGVVDRVLDRTGARPGGLPSRRPYRPLTPLRPAADWGRSWSVAEPRGPPAVLVSSSTEYCLS